MDCCRRENDRSARFLVGGELSRRRESRRVCHQPVSGRDADKPGAIAGRKAMRGLAKVSLVWIVVSPMKGLTGISCHLHQHIHRPFPDDHQQDQDDSGQNVDRHAVTVIIVSIGWILVPFDILDQGFAGRLSFRQVRVPSGGRTTRTKLDDVGFARPAVLSHARKPGCFRDGARKRTTVPCPSVNGNEPSFVAELVCRNGWIMLVPTPVRRASPGAGLVNMPISFCLPAFFPSGLKGARPDRTLWAATRRRQPSIICCAHVRTTFRLIIGRFPNGLFAAGEWSKR